MFDSEVYFFNLIHTLIYFVLIYNELSQKTSFQSGPIATLCVYNIQREKSVNLSVFDECMYIYEYIVMQVCVYSAFEEKFIISL